MEHLDDEALALVAIGEPLTDPAVIEHVSRCDACRHEIEALRSTVAVARSTIGETALTPPPARVWQSVRAELGLAADLEPVGGVADVEASTTDARPNTLAPVVQLDRTRERRSGIRRILVPVAAVAAAAALVGGGVLWGASVPRDAGQFVASAQLEALPEWAGASGQATITERGDGERVITVSLDATVDDGVVREVWLMTENIEGLMSLGYLTGSTGAFVVPASVDLAQFSVVDVSAEPVDGDPTHSGDSIVRGALTA
jgi:hypothetical protein